MDYKKLSMILPMVGVAVMMIWGFAANDWSRSWIAAAVGGILSGICRVMAGPEDKDKKE